MSWTPEPPSVLYIQSWPVRAAMTYWPSADQMGEAKLMRSDLVMMRGLLPSALEIQMFLEPLRSLMKASCLPSGEKRGCWSQPVPLVMRVAWPPAIGIV